MKKSLLTFFFLAACAFGAMAQGCPTPTSVEASVTFKRKIPGLLDGEFSVSATKKVHFAGGNLQYTKSTGKWKIMDHQYDMVETLSQNVGADYADQDVVTLFGWATSGHNSKYPYMTSSTASDYGPSISSGEWTSDSNDWDWGVKNSSDLGSGWRVLTAAEWVYLLNSTNSTDPAVGRQGNRYAKATVHGIVGLIIVPDDYNSTLYPLNSVNTESAAYTSNIIDASDWSKMENIGCVFLPAAGSRDETTVNDVASYGNYWSITYYTIEGAHYLNFNTGNLYPSGFYYTRNRIYGHSVRLVKDVQ